VGCFHHGASAAQKLRAVGEDLAHAAIPLDRAVTLAVAAAAMHPFFAIFGFVAGLCFDALELVLLPLMLLKNLVDAGAHAAAVGLSAAQGERDGEVDARDIRPFDLFDAGSAKRQTKAPWRPVPLAPPAPSGVALGG
jgi:hypothetical protein